MKLFLLLTIVLHGFITHSQLSVNEQKKLSMYVITSVNKLRNKHSSSALKYNDTLFQAAEFHSKYMLSNKILSHNQKTAKYKTPYARVQEFNGTAFQTVGENIYQSKAQRFPLEENDLKKLAEEIFEGWKNSEAHYENMINSEYTHAALAFAVNKDGVFYVTHVFGRKGFVVEGQLSNDAFGIKKAPQNCGDSYKAFLNIVMNLANNTEVSGNDIILYASNLDVLKKIVNSPTDGIVIDLIHKKQFPCNRENQLDASLVYDGILLKPIYRDELFNNNQAQSKYRLISKVGEVPANININDYSISIILLKNGKACRYIYQVEVDSDYYPLNKIKTIVEDNHIELRNKPLTGTETIKFDFDVNQFNLKSIPKISSFEGVKLIIIKAFSSVEGDSTNNIRLQNERARTILKFIESSIPLENVKIEIEAKENWEQFRFQLQTIGQHKLAIASNDSLRVVIKERLLNFPNWDKVFAMQRTSYVNIFYEINKTVEPKLLPELNLRSAILENNELLVQKALFKLYDSEGQSNLAFLLEPQIVDYFYKNNKGLGNYFALLTDVFHDNPHEVVRLVNYWINHFSELSIAAKQNLLNLYTHLNVFLLQDWDVSSSLLASVMSPYVIQKLYKPDELVIDLLLNLHSSFLLYYGHTNDGSISESFQFISNHYKSKSLTIQEDVDLILFYNHYSMFKLTYDRLKPKIEEKIYNEQSLFSFIQTMLLMNEEIETDFFADVNRQAAILNSKRWCRYISNNFQILRNEKIKTQFCETCKSEF